METQRADGEQLVVLRPALQALIARLEHTPLLKARLKGIGALPHGSQDLRGPVARASGRTEDARQADAMYCELGFELYIEGAGDAWARFRQRHVEIVTSLDLVEAAGDPELPKLRAIDSPSGTGEATVETPRGRSTLQLTLERGQVQRIKRAIEKSIRHGLHTSKIFRKRYSIFVLIMQLLHIILWVVEVLLVRILDGMKRMGKKVYIYSN